MNDHNVLICCRCECFDYLFDISVEMKKMGIDPCDKPTYPEGAYVSKMNS